MIKFLIEVDKDMATLVRNEAKNRNLTSEEFIRQILNRYLVPSHTINKEQMKDGYEAMADINLELANL